MSKPTTIKKRKPTNSKGRHKLPRLQQQRELADQLIDQLDLGYLQIGRLQALMYNYRGPVWQQRDGRGTHRVRVAKVNSK